MATTAAQDEFNALFSSKNQISSHHPSDSPLDRSDAASFLEDDSASDHTPPASVHTVTNNARAKYTVPSARHQSNTGPKGVITDAQAYRAAARARTSEGMSRASFQAQRENDSRVTQPYVPGVGEVKVLEEQDEEEELDGEDDEVFMESWRRERLRELQNHNGRRIGSAGREGGSRKRGFGGLVPVDGTGFLEAVDGSGRETVVVVYIYDDQSEVSDLIEVCVQELARKYINTRFVKLHYHDAEMEPAGVPAVLAYKGGDKFAGLVPVLNEIPDDADVTASTLEKVFQKHQIL
ncbi:hypothetical protein KVT40_001104 [Elsinoe batatas]|uniref:Phosducin domain-containing protein n=1 Tax=Elsinoe batatas TaxID=2601811 RepID=A0A8K0PNA4_9PEZI|nr:hypothetical protein KVT40_001104 [Elsinoe batatas]